MAATSTVEIRVMDMPELRAKLAEMETRIASVVAERDKALAERESWEDAYDSLLGSVGGTSPG